MFTDIHAHILHNIDDGPKTLESSAELLKYAISKGCNQIIATPHFYASMHGLEERVDLAKERFEALKKLVFKLNLPVEICLGYEVRFFKGISHCDGLEKICLNNSKTILLELGPKPITNSITEEICELNYLGYTVILAHIERYFKDKGFKSLKTLVSDGVALAQVNASSFVSGHFVHIVKRLLKENSITFVAGDMHSVDLRPPYMAEAFEKIKKLSDENTVNSLIKNSSELFNLIK